MDYTQSPEFVTHPGTGQRLHDQNQPVPTEVTDKDMNSLIWSLMEVAKAAGLAGQQFDPATPATYQVVRNALAELGRRGYGAVAVAAGTADAITATLSPAPVALVDGMTVRVRAAAANATTAPTLALNGLAAKVIVKGNGRPLAAGDIAGAGHWMALQFDSLLDKWVLCDPAFGVAPDISGFTGANQSHGSSGWQRLPGGLILQWGSSAGGVDILPPAVGVSITFPLAFTSACYQVVGTLLSTGGGGANGITASGFNLTGCSFTIEEWAAVGQGAGVRYIAIGR